MFGRVKGKRGGESGMKRETAAVLLVRAVYMTAVYLMAGVCVNTVAAMVSMEFYRAHLMLWTFFAALVTIPLCLWQMKREGFLKREVFWNSEKRGRYAAGDWLMMVLLSVSSCIAFNYWILLSGLPERFRGFDKVAEAIYGGNLLEELLAVAVAAPVVEELLFRGLAYNGFRKLWGRGTAMVVSALFFGVYHRNVLQGLYAFLIGLLLVYVYEAFGTIRASVLFHIAANTASVLMTECLDMGWLEKSIGNMFLFTVFFTLTGIASFLWIEWRRRLRKT